MQLHARKTQGETLTAEEASQLESWYTSQDAEESSWFNISTAPANVSITQSQLNSVLNQLTKTLSAFKK